MAGKGDATATTTAEASKATTQATTPVGMPTYVHRTIDDCPRCGQKHVGLQFRQLQRPAGANDTALTHWASCPHTAEPLLVGVLAPVATQPV